MNERPRENTIPQPSKPYARVGFWAALSRAIGMGAATRTSTRPSKHLGGRLSNDERVDRARAERKRHRKHVRRQRR